MNANLENHNYIYIYSKIANIHNIIQMKQKQQQQKIRIYCHECNLITIIFVVLVSIKFHINFVNMTKTKI